MADLTQDALVDTRPAAGVLAVPIADGVQLFRNQLISLDGGYAQGYGDTGGERFAGLLKDGFSRTRDGVVVGEVSDTPPPEAFIDISGATITGLAVGGSPTQANVGDAVYCATDNPADITLSAVGRTRPIGYLSRFNSATDQEVTLFSMGEHVAQELA